MFPTKYAEGIGAHHSSLSKEVRFSIEERLRKGELKVVVTSTSLELGIDIGYVDLVILLGSPKSTARALQRCLSYDAEILCGDGKYRKIGEIAEEKMQVDVISYDKNKGFLKNKIKIWHKNKEKEILRIKLKCGEEIKCTKEHPILTKEGWKTACELREGNLIAEVRKKIEFEDKSPYLFELLPKDKIFVANIDNFFQKTIDEYMRKNNFNCESFAKEFGMSYSRFTDCRRLSGRKKSIRLDYFLKACRLCDISKEEYLPYLENLKTKGRNWAKWPRKLNEELMWLAGIVTTDGCIVRSQKTGEAEYYKIKIGNKSKVLIDKAKEIAKKLGANPYLRLREDIFYELDFGSNLLAHLLMALGIPCKRKSYNIEINNNVFSLPQKLIHAYLEGIFEGDGNLNIKKNKNHGLIRFFTASEKFARGLHLLCSRMGYNNKVKKSKIKASNLIKKVSDRDLYCIGLYRKEDLRKFFESIPCYGEKAMKGRLLTKDFKPYLSLKKDYNEFLDFSEVESVNIEKKEMVYNLTLENEPNNFIVGNVIVHNCGRAGHRLHDTVKGRFVVLDRDDLVECAVILKEAIEKKIDKVQIPKNCLDVLSQQIFGMAISKVWDIDEMLSLIKKSYCYKDLKREDFLDVVSYLSGEYALEHRNVYAKIWYDQETRQIGKRGKLARVIYMTNIGTIPEEGFINVVIHPEQRVGKIDEAFLERMKPGDVFVLGGQRYQFLYTRGMNAYVRASLNRPPTIPSWFSEMLPLSFDLALEIQRFRKLVDEKLNKENKKEAMNFIQEWLYVDEQTSEAIYNYFYEQKKYIGIPSSEKIIIENYKGDKKYIVFHSLFGRRVNDALSRAIGFLAGRLGGRDIEIGINDNGFFLSGENLQVEKAVKYLNSGNIEEILKEAIEKTEVLKRRFRHCAARSLMILRSYKGRTKSVGKQNMSSHFLISAVKKLSDNFPILREARREVLEDLMDIENARKVLDWIKEGKIKIEYKDTNLPSPFSLNLILQGYSDLIKIEDKIAFLKRMHDAVKMKIRES
jgi:intein/homing endonuclease